MRNVTLLCAVLIGAASAQDVTVGPIKMAGFVNREVRQVKDAQTGQAFNLYQIQNANPLDVDLEVVKGGYPGNATLTSLCKKSVLGILKAPATARFSDVRAPTYTTAGGVYYVSGFVDSQNSYGALLRSRFYCTMAYSGTERSGLLYILPDLVEKR